MMDVGVLLLLLLPPATRVLPDAEYCERCREGDEECDDAPDMTPGGRPAMAVD